MSRRLERGFTVMEVLIVITVIAIIAALAIPGLIASQRSSHERNASTSLKTLCVAEADFRSNDRDGNKVMDFWTGDMKGLYTLTNTSVAGAGGGTTDPPLRLIELSMATADSDDAVYAAGGENMSVTSFGVIASKAGYWYAALTLDQSITGPEQTYKTDTGGTPPMGTVHNLHKYAFLTFPESNTFGKYVFIVNENNTIYRSATTGPTRLGTANPPGVAGTGFPAVYGNWPDDANLKSYWAKLE
jgi:prepilin-type N-terminal cleavage/methylation domain-containing protein